MAAADHFAVTDDDRADGDFSVIHRETGFRQRFPHEAVPFLRRRIRPGDAEGFSFFPVHRLTSEVDRLEQFREQQDESYEHGR